MNPNSQYMGRVTPTGNRGRRWTVEVVFAGGETDGQTIQVAAADKGLPKDAVFTVSTGGEGTGLAMVMAQAYVNQSDANAGELWLYVKPQSAAGAGTLTVRIARVR